MKLILETEKQSSEEKNCKNCKNFRLHYIKYSRGNYSALGYGDCVKPRLKKRYINDKPCQYWEIQIG